MQQPEPIEEFIVVSGKHSFAAQMSNVIKKLSDMRIIKKTTATGKMVRPDLVNIVPNRHTEAPVIPQIGQGEIRSPRPARRNIVLR